jgi:hypothetical protein
MGVLKSVGIGLLSFIIVMTLPTGIFAYFFFQEFDPSNLEGQVLGSVLGSMLDSEQFRPMLEEFESGLDEMLDSGLRDLCAMDPELNLADLLNMSEQYGGLPQGEGMELFSAMFSSISCSEINETTTGADLVDIIVDDIQSGEVELPASLTNMTGMDMGGDGFSGILGQLGAITGTVDRYVHYMIMVGLVCSVLLLVIIQDPAEFSRKMGMVFLSQGIFMIVFVYGLESALPMLINMFAGGFGGGGSLDVQGMVTPIMNALIFDPLKAVMWVNFTFVVAGASAYIIGKVAEKRMEGSRGE